MGYASIPKMNCPIPSLRARGSASTVALRALMEQQQKIEIGQRIRELRENSAETNRSIADYCKVSVEAVRNWIAGKGISYDNGEKVAKLFDVDFNWLWRGESKGETPDVLRSLSGNSADELARLSDAVEELRVELAAARNELLAEIAQVRRAQEAPQKRRGNAGRSQGGSGN